jgi:outer membrane protein TolC
MDQLKLRTEELQMQRTLNQIRVEVKNAVIGLQQARVRYETAVNTRVLAEQSLQSEQTRFQFGATGSDVTTVIQAQQDLANDQSLEVQAMASYVHARIDYDQAIGQTLDVNHVKMEEALSGHVERSSFLPNSLPGGRQ